MMPKLGMGRRWFRRPRVDDFSDLGNIKKFSYSSLRIATYNFSKDRLIGAGGSARVFKGLLSDGTLIAVKNYGNTRSNQGLEIEFMCSVKLMSRIGHRNIEKLIGYCKEDGLLLLVTEYAEFGSLHDLLQNPARKEFGSWHSRSAICMGIARGISYLHHDTNPCAIHCDIKPGNILIDSNFNPKICDFGIVKVFQESKESELELTHQTSRIAGTIGYMPIEYLETGMYSRKTDVFSFGVVMLQLISGRNVHDHFHEYVYEKSRPCSFIAWASFLIRNDRVLEFIDPVLTDYHVDVVQSFITVALLCVQRDPVLRPSMQEALHMLYGVCNSSSQSPTRLSISMLDDLIISYPAFQWGNPYTSAEIEDERESLILLDEGIGTGNDSADALVDSNTGMNSQGEGEGVESRTTEEHRHQQQTNKKMMKPGIVLSGSGDLVERLSQSQTMVLKKRPENVFPEAVYPPLLTSVFRRPGSGNHVERHYRTMDFKKNVFPEAIYPPFHTRGFKSLGSRNLYTCDF